MCGVLVLWCVTPFGGGIRGWVGEVESGHLASLSLGPAFAVSINFGGRRAPRLGRARCLFSPSFFVSLDSHNNNKNSEQETAALLPPSGGCAALSALPLKLIIKTPPPLPHLWIPADIIACQGGLCKEISQKRWMDQGGRINQY